MGLSEESIPLDQAEIYNFRFQIFEKVKKTGDDYYDSAEFREMLAEYEQAVSTGQPVFLDADELSEIADYYQMSNRPDDADKAISLALSLAPGAIGPLTYSIHEALFRGDTQKARELLDQIIEKDEPDYVYDYGEILLAEERDDEADEYFEEAMKSVPDEEMRDYLLDVAGIMNDYSRSDLAMKWLERAPQEDSTDYKELKARALLGMGQYEDSEKLYNELIDTNPFSKKYWSQLALAQYMRDDFSAAIQSCEYAIAIDPDDPDSISTKANSLYNLGNYEEALEYFRRHAELVPNNDYSYLNQGYCLLNLGQREQALEVLLRGVEVAQPDSPHLPDLYQQLAFIYSDMQQTDKALEYLDKTDQLDCDHVTMCIIKGHALLMAKRFQEAQAKFSEAVRISDNPQATLVRVIVSLYDNHYVEASYRMFRNFFKTAPPDFTDGYAYMALCCYDLKKYDEFLIYLKKACEVNPAECQLALAHLFPKDIDPKDYYEYTKTKLGTEN